MFFDKELSRDGTVSCASCHQPDKAFADGRALPVGIDHRPGRRNVPTLVNCAYGKSMFWDGRVATLEEQALSPLTDPSETAFSLHDSNLVGDVDERAVSKWPSSSPAE